MNDKPSYYTYDQYMEREIDRDLSVLKNKTLNVNDLYSVDRALFHKSLTFSIATLLMICTQRNHQTEAHALLTLMQVPDGGMDLKQRISYYQLFGK